MALVPAQVHRRTHFASNRPSAGPPSARASRAANSRWTCLVAASHWQLWLARPLVSDVHLPWEHPRSDRLPTPGQVQRHFPRLLTGWALLPARLGHARKIARSCPRPTPTTSTPLRSRAAPSSASRLTSTKPSAKLQFLTLTVGATASTHLRGAMHATGAHLLGPPSPAATRSVGRGRHTSVTAGGKPFAPPSALRRWENAARTPRLTGRTSQAKWHWPRRN